MSIEKIDKTPEMQNPGHVGFFEPLYKKATLILNGRATLVDKSRYNVVSLYHDEDRGHGFTAEDEQEAIDETTLR